MGLLGSLGFSSGGVGNSSSTTQNIDRTVDYNVSPAVQDGGTIVNAVEGSFVNFTDAGAIENAFDFADSNQAFLNESFSSVIGLGSDQNDLFYNSFGELIDANNSVTERALESANVTRNLAFDNIKAVTGKIASIAQTQAGDIKPLVTNAIIGLAVITGLFFVGSKVFK